MIRLVLAAAAAVFGVALVGPLGHHDVFGGDVVKLRVRVMAQGGHPSEIDGAPVAAEAVQIWASAFTAEDHQHRTLQRVAGADRPREAVTFRVATGGAAIAVRVDPKTTIWAIGEGPSRRIAFPGQIATGRGFVGLPVANYVAKSHRIVEGEHLIVTAVHDDVQGGELTAIGVADEDHEAALGDDFAPSPRTRLAGLGLLAVAGLILLGVKRKAA